MDFAAPILRAALVVATATAAATIGLAIRNRENRYSRAGRWPLDRWSRYAAASGGAASIFVALPGVSARIESITGVDNLGMVMVHLLGILTVASLQAFLVTWTYQRDAWRLALRVRFGAAFGVAVAITVLGLSAPSGIDLINGYADAGAAAIYLLVIDTYWAVTGIAVAWDCLPLAIFNARGGHRSIAAAQGLIAASGVASALWGGTEAAFVAVTQIRGDAWNTSTQDAVSSSSAGLFALCLFSGIAVSIRARRNSR
ncbi:hypothetical protein [Kitasatospora sp. NPDC092286]|uniref:hypothetical protein n=1 Tax=Kitasatospora sp. NPDC092286 TaxID=3364087 RepID=UPI003804587F